MEQKRNMTAVTVRMSMLPVGKTGLVFCSADTVSPVLCEVNDKGWLRGRRGKSPTGNPIMT